MGWLWCWFGFHDWKWGDTYHADIRTDDGSVRQGPVQPAQCQRCKKEKRRIVYVK